MNKTIKQIKMNKLLLLFTLFFVFGKMQAQQQVVFQISQSDSLIANAGESFSLSPGNSSIIGGSPTAIGGDAPYYYSWTPVVFLDDSVISNPTSSPVETITYMVSLHDANNCSASDSVLITIDSTSGIFDLSNENDKIPYVFYSSENDAIKILNLFPEKITVLIADILGKTLFYQDFGTKTKSELNIPVHNLPQTMIVNISGKGKSYSYKIIKN
ncbi:MAG: hypothetical protein PHY85_08265 [Bacteroidales bacterium]|nr:hypothetical protein [Bacteroidales bacterium]